MLKSNKNSRVYIGGVYPPPLYLKLPALKTWLLTSKWKFSYGFDFNANDWFLFGPSSPVVSSARRPSRLDEVPRRAAGRNRPPEDIGPRPLHVRELHRQAVLSGEGVHGAHHVRAGGCVVVAAEHAARDDLG